MENINIYKEIFNNTCSVCIDNFNLNFGSIDFFLKRLSVLPCVDYGEWYQGIESGIGHIFFHKKKIMVFWNDFPDQLSFDMRNEQNGKNLLEIIQSMMTRYSKNNNL